MRINSAPRSGRGFLYGTTLAAAPHLQRGNPA